MRPYVCTRQSVKCVIVRIFSIVTRKIKKTYTNIYTYIYIHHQQKRRQQQQHHHPSSFGTNANTPMLFIHNIYNCIYYWHCVPLAHSVLYTVCGRWRRWMSSPLRVRNTLISLSIQALITCARIAWYFASHINTARFIISMGNVFHSCNCQK